jgi:hypothetical protein
MEDQNRSNNPDMTEDVKEDYSKVEHYEDHAKTAIPADFNRAHKSKWESLGRIQTIKLFWKMSLVCFVVAFSAAADGYQVCLGTSFESTTTRR